MSRRDADASKGIAQCLETWSYREPGRSGPYGCHTFACKLEKDHDGPHVDHFGLWDERVIFVEEPAKGASDAK